ncbi:hypothetical protein CVT26_015317 [Gymnopilus dilepis]|uniref:Uncharacterized protein n=1 Tax=Gymnopilus dilepis TaxID=231916 RepID=A0A409W4F2_9AGAR|nr:hypothetical protein CVT26_015317 [Gymnopilus dilepis]
MSVLQLLLEGGLLVPRMVATVVRKSLAMSLSPCRSVLTILAVLHFPYPPPVAEIFNCYLSCFDYPTSPVHAHSPGKMAPNTTDLTLHPVFANVSTSSFRLRLAPDEPVNQILF